jgi:hypothetical protein
MDHFWTSLVTIATGIIGVAIIAVIVSNRAQTSGVISATTSGFANDLLAATAPVTGASGTINTGGSAFGNLGFSGQGAGITSQAY